MSHLGLIKQETILWSWEVCMALNTVDHHVSDGSWRTVNEINHSQLREQWFSVQIFYHRVISCLSLTGVAYHAQLSTRFDTGV